MRRPVSEKLSHTLRQSGFTLVEAIVVIAITGILAAMVSMFMKAPIDAYFDTARRAELTDAADTALRRMARDLRLSVPNSVRVSSDGQFIEVLAAARGGRYRVEDDGSSGTNDPLDFTTADTQFDILGPTISFSSGDQLVVYNLGIPGADAYEGNTADTHVRRAISGISGNRVTLSSSARLPFDSPSHRFQITSGPVAYLCSSGNLDRVEGYGIQTSVATAYALAAAGTRTRLASHIGGCSFSYDNAALTRTGTVSMRLTLSKDGESVTLFNQIHVPNTP